MRVAVAGPHEAKRGQSLRLDIELRRGQTHAFCELYSAVGDYAPSPFIPHARLSLTRDGKPDMLPATTFRLSDQRPRRTFTFEADEDCAFTLMQDIDVKGDALVIARISKNDYPSALRISALRWLRRMLDWTPRRQDARKVRVSR